MLLTKTFNLANAGQNRLIFMKNLKNVVFNLYDFDKFTPTPTPPPPCKFPWHDGVIKSWTPPPLLRHCVMIWKTLLPLQASHDI